MTSSPAVSEQKNAPKMISFWERIVNELRDCAPLEKLLVGCELIAALDGIELLAA